MFIDYPWNNVLDSNDTQVPGSILMSASLSRCDPAKEEKVDDDVRSSPVNVSVPNGNHPSLPVVTIENGETTDTNNQIIAENHSNGSPDLAVAEQDQAVQPANGFDHLEAQGKSNSFSYP